MGAGTIMCARRVEFFAGNLLMNYLVQRMDELPYYDTEPEDVQTMLEQNPRNILFLGDSHDRYAYYCTFISLFVI